MTEHLNNNIRSKKPPSSIGGGLWVDQNGHGYLRLHWFDYHLKRPFRLYLTPEQVVSLLAECERVERPSKVRKWLKAAERELQQRRRRPTQYVVHRRSGMLNPGVDHVKGVKKRKIK